MKFVFNAAITLCMLVLLAESICAQSSVVLNAANGSPSDSFEAARRVGLEGSKLLRGSNQTQSDAGLAGGSESDRDTFQQTVAPILKDACQDCHGDQHQEGSFQVASLNLEFTKGGDAGWWQEVLKVISTGEMPPADAGTQLADKQRNAVINWITTELHTASIRQRGNAAHSSFRRMTKYETNYALQDLLGLPYNFVTDLPPETASEDGFLNSAEMLHLSPSQLVTYRELACNALKKATVRGPKPDVIRYGIAMRSAAQVMLEARRARRDPDAKNAQFEPVSSLRTRSPYFVNTSKGIGIAGAYAYHNARYSLRPNTTVQDISPTTWGDDILVLPVGGRQIFDLGDHLPDHGPLKVRFHARHRNAELQEAPELRVSFGFQASNNSQTSFRIGDNIAIDAIEESPDWFTLTVPLGEISRNPFRGRSKLGDTPNPSEYLVLQNVARTRRMGEIEIDFIEVIAGEYPSWPPASHRRIFGEKIEADAGEQEVKQILEQFMRRAWRRPISGEEVTQKLALYQSLRPHCQDSQAAMIEVLASVVASPKFLYVPVLSNGDTDSADFLLASRLATFLWCSIPDEELLELAGNHRLADTRVLVQQCRRMLADPRSQRFQSQFVSQWLGMQLLDYLQVDKKLYPSFDSTLRDAMAREPIVFFEHMLQSDASVLDFLHANYTFVNNRLAQHYKIPNVFGSHFRKVELPDGSRRGGLLTQAGLLAMNSDGKDSHPLKRGIWLLERILNDAPPPPPPAVPEIDLADPEILKLTLKQRMEDHRSDVACMSCHSKIDPWGIAFENFDATGNWRDQIGEDPVDARSLLFNREPLDGVDGLKRYLLAQRQDQFVTALTHKLAVFAIGRPLGFADRAQIDDIATKVRQQGDGLRTLIELIVTSELFRQAAE